MTFALALTIAALLVALLQRWRTHAPLGLDAALLTGAGTLVLVGIAGTLLAVAGALRAGTAAAVIGALALALWPWRRPPATRSDASGRRLTLVLALVLVAIAGWLRAPPMVHALAGRDQGSYQLRAEFTARTGGFDLIDPVVRDAAARGDADVLGLYPRRGEAWRDDLYEAGYRPGWYLADRERGLVVPQFLHLHPALLAIAVLLAGPTGPAWLVLLQGVASVLALWAIARQLWPRSWLSLLPALWLAISPLSVWVHRNTLTEGLTGLLTLTAVLACLRARDASRERELVIAAVLLGATAWVRGNAWLTAPVVLSTLWLLPRGRGRSHATAALLLMLLGSVIVHGATVFPYLHDELARLMQAWSRPSPVTLVLGCVLAMALWWAIDELGFGPRGRFADAPLLARVRSAGPRLSLLAAAIALAWWAASRGEARPPWSRLDALLPALGLPLLAPAVLGVARGAWRFRPTARAADVWLWALAQLVVATVALYAARTLPKFGLFYYGRYLVPELLPLACLGATATLWWLQLRTRSGGTAVAGLAAIAITAGVAWPLLRTPQTRLQEFVGAGRIVDALAERVPADAIVVAGGEGWHHGHTFNQVAGALALRHGRAVLPYYNREAAYASVHALLVDAPARSGVAPPRVFVLVGEASHASTAAEDPVATAIVDDLLPPPLLPGRAVTFELVTDRLTAADDGLPTAVTREVLRMALFEVVRDDADRSVTRIHFDADGHATVDGAALEGPPPQLPARDGDARCLDPQTELTLALPSRATAIASVVIVALPGTAPHNEHWTVAIDGTPRTTGLRATAVRARATLGPLPVIAPPRQLSLRGSPRADDDAPCPHGGVAEIRLLGPDRSRAAIEPPEQLAFAPPDDLGHAVVPARWRFGRGLSRYRPQLAGDVAISGVSLQLTAAQPLVLGPEPFAGPVGSLAVALSASRASADARIVVQADGVTVAQFDPPELRDRSWQSPRVPMPPGWHGGAVVQWSLQLVGAQATDELWVRDLSLVSGP
ncbi:MAG: hypothetical protein K1X88_08070 [Nannocystaceae bacterium]|nr:hypothetical protein [Nannocystaceae bacterium]